MPRVIPGCRAVVVIHEEGPSSLRVNFYFPSEGERVAVVVGHRQYRRLRLHAVHVVGSLSGTETFYTGDGRFKRFLEVTWRSGLEVSRNSRVNVGADGAG